MSEDKAKQPYRGRLAPTPSGFLHLGHVHTFRVASERSRLNKGKLIYRMDDLDPDRCTSEYVQACIDDMRSMGLEWDEGPDVGGPVSPYYQSKRGDLYFDALKALYELIWSTLATSPEKKFDLLDLWILEVSNFFYPEYFRQSSRGAFPEDFPGNCNWRFRTQWGKKVEFQDIKKAEQSFLVGKDLSDFLVWRKGGVAAYELATVVDDYLMKITEVVRGEDLLLSSARQCLLFDAFGWCRPDFYHCELLLGEDGKKLSKSTRSLPRLFSVP